MKLKIASSLEELESAPWKEFAGYIETGSAALSGAISELSNLLGVADVEALIDAIQQQLDAWEDC